MWSVALLLTTVLLVGDSTTDCMNANPTHDFRPEYAMEALLGTEYEVVNHAVGASNTKHWTGDVAPYCVPALAPWWPVMASSQCATSFTAGSIDLEPNPDLVLITLGTNDHAYSDPVGTAARIETIRTAYEATGAEVRVAPPMPVNPAWAHAAFIDGVTAEIAGDFAHPVYPLGDMVHPTDAGCWMQGAYLASLLTTP